MPPFQTRPAAPTRVEAVQLRGPVRVGKQKGRAGDWLVTHESGALSVIGAREFAAAYEPVENGTSRGGGGRTGNPPVAGDHAPGVVGRKPGRRHHRQRRRNGNRAAAGAS